MTAFRQGWLVAAREMRERGRSRAFQVSLVVTTVIVLAVIVVPSLFEDREGTRDVGFAGSTPDGLTATLRDQGEAADLRVRVRQYDDVTVGRQAVRDGAVDVLVVDAHRLEWRQDVDATLQAAVTGAIQQTVIVERAAAAGIDPGDLSDLLAPVPIENVELGAVEGRSTDDETAALLMTVLLFVAITTYGNLVMTGVVEEKASRVVEVLLSRMPARTLLAGKVAGIGLLGFLQFVGTALVALVATTLVDSVDVPAARGAVLFWVVVWFVLGYALYAVVYGALGSLASRPEDAQSAAGPVMVVLLVGYFASFVAVGRPEGQLARFLSLFPPTAPLAMPTRLAMGAAEWWESLVAVVLTLATIVGLVWLGGRVYAGAVLHTGRTLRLREAWRRSAAT